MDEVEMNLANKERLKNMQYRDQLESHALLLKQQKMQIDRIEQMQK